LSAKELNQEKALVALMESPNTAAAAKTLRVSVRTLYRYMDDQGFQIQFRKMRRELVERSVARLQKSTDAASEALERNLSCGNPAVEVRAAAVIFENAIRGVELGDLQTRVEMIEDALKRQTQPN
jgi:hypothetical protein